MIVRAGAVVTMDGPVIEDGAVRVRENWIVEVGQAAKVSSSEEEIVDLRDFVLLPGLINAHCHLDYTCLRGKIAPAKSFTDWIRAINAEKAKLTPRDYLESVRQGFVEARRFGTTSLVNLEAFPELIAQSRPKGLRLWWCAELIDVASPGQATRIAAAACGKMRNLTDDSGGFGLAPHALFTASAELYRACEELADRENFLFTTHLAESDEEMQMFRDGRGPLFDLLAALDRDMSDTGRGTPLQTFFAVNKATLTNKLIIAHLNELTEEDFGLLAAMPPTFSIAHCPRSHAYFRHKSFEFERLRNLGFNVCLGTDSLASNSDLSLFAEMREFRKAYPLVPANHVLQAVTVNPAAALGSSHRLGRVRAGHLADMIALPMSDLADVYEDILSFAGAVPWTMTDGEVGQNP